MRGPGTTHVSCVGGRMGEHGVSGDTGRANVAPRAKRGMGSGVGEKEAVRLRPAGSVRGKCRQMTSTPDEREFASHPLWEQGKVGGWRPRETMQDSGGTKGGRPVPILFLFFRIIPSL